MKTAVTWLLLAAAVALAEEPPKAIRALGAPSVGELLETFSARKLATKFGPQKDEEKLFGDGKARFLAPDERPGLRETTIFARAGVSRYQLLREYGRYLLWDAAKEKPETVRSLEAKVASAKAPADRAPLVLELVHRTDGETLSVCLLLLGERESLKLSEDELLSLVVDGKNAGERALKRLLDLERPLAGTAHEARLKDRWKQYADALRTLEKALQSP